MIPLFCTGSYWAIQCEWVLINLGIPFLLGLLCHIRGLGKNMDS